jgi:hypothetical protein
LAAQCWEVDVVVADPLLQNIAAMLSRNVGINFK